MPGLARLTALHCVHPQGGSGDDELLMRRGDGMQIWPSSGTFGMNIAHTAHMIIDVPVSGDEVEIQLWEIDDFKDDKLASFVINLDEGPGEHTQILEGDAAYNLTYKVARIDI